MLRHPVCSCTLKGPASKTPRLRLLHQFPEETAMEWPIENRVGEVGIKQQTAYLVRWQLSTMLANHKIPTLFGMKQNKYQNLCAVYRDSTHYIALSQTNHSELFSTLRAFCHDLRSFCGSWQRRCDLKLNWWKMRFTSCLWSWSWSCCAELSQPVWLQYKIKMQVMLLVMWCTVSAQMHQWKIFKRNLPGRSLAS